MHTITNTSMTLKLTGAILALALIAAAALAVTFAIGQAQAQNATNTYTDPQPCGPGGATAFMPEPHEVTAGHFLLFDAYWQSTTPSGDPVNTGVLHTNLCPPKVVATTTVDRRGGFQRPHP